MAIWTNDRWVAGLVGTALLGIIALLTAACSERPDAVAGRFYDRLAALDIDGMAETVCAEEQAAFRESVAFLESVRDAEPPALEDFATRTERSDGTAVTLRVSGTFVDREEGEMVLAARLRLVREGGEWCISGEDDGFTGVRGSAADVFALLIRGGISGDFGPGVEPDGTRSSTREVVVNTPPPEGPPTVEGEVITTASGLRYIDIEPGSGAQPEAGQRVAVHYTLWVEASGEMIDSTLKREPFEFVLGSGEVIDGFDEGVSTMKEGGRRRLTVPWRLAYKDDYVDGYGDRIEKNSTLLFDVELVEVR